MDRKTANDGNAQIIASERTDLFLYVQTMGLITICLNSVVIPEAASLMLKLKWFVLLLSVLPYIMHYYNMPSSYSTKGRAAGILASNLVVLMISYFISKEFSKNGLEKTGMLSNFLSENPDLDFPGTIPVILGCTGIVITLVGLLAFAILLVDNDTRTAGGKFGYIAMITMSSSLTAPFILPYMYFPSSLDICVNLFRPVQALSASLILSAFLTYPNLSQINTNCLFFWSFIGLCIFHGIYSLWSGALISPDFFFSGIISVIGCMLTIFGIILQHKTCQFSLSSQQLHDELNYDFKKVSTGTALLLIELMWIKSRIESIIETLPTGKLCGLSCTVPSITGYAGLQPIFLFAAKLVSVALVYMLVYQLSPKFRKVIAKYWKNMIFPPEKHRIMVFACCIVCLLSFMRPNISYSFWLVAATYVAVTKFYNELPVVSEDRN